MGVKFGYKWSGSEGSFSWNKLYDIWQPSQAFKLMDIENDYFLVTFRSRSDYLHVLIDGPWLVFGHYVSVESWTEDFSTAQPYPGNIIAWIRLPGLPVTLYKRSLITALGECIASVLKLDYQTETGCRGKFARMAVRINLNQPLVSKIIVNGKVQLVEYESLPTVCFNCGKYGHMNEICPDRQPPPSTEVPLPPSEPSPPTPSTMYGPWMVVEKRQRRPQTRVAVGDDNALRANVTASRFAPIFDSNVAVSAPTEVSRPPTTSSTSASKRIFKAKHVPTKQVPSTQKYKGKATSAVNVRKPLQINLADFPILPRSSHKAGPSTHMPSSKVSFRLDGNKHSSISLPENSDPNISAGGSSLMASIVPGEPPQKQPDPPLSASKPTGQAEEVPPRDMQFSARLADASGMLTLGPLYDYVQLPPSSMPQISFASVLNDRGEWDIAQLSTVFMATAVPYILGIKPPNPNSGPDMCVWRWTDHQEFVLKSAYQQCVPPVLGVPDPLWKHIWRLHVPQRIRCFLWLACRQKLMTNLERCKRKLTDDSFCPVCNREVETIIHIFRDCVYLRQYWRRFVPQAILSTFFSSDVQGALDSHSTTLPAPWSNPEPDCYCLNIDGAVSLNSGKATIGGLLRDAAGNFLFGFSKFIGCVNSLNAELWSLYIGLQLAWDYGIDYLQIQTDCKQITQLLAAPNVESSPLPLVRSIRKFWGRAWFINLIWTPRSGNMAADKLARLANCSSFDLSFYSSPPSELRDILYSDALLVPM
ncbi:hypothetical protein GQ457_07G033850 [Hibiscus cannabinus]